MRRRLAAVALLALLSLSGPASSHDRRPGPQPARHLKADRNANKLLDDLERSLATSGQSAASVIVTLRTPARQGRIAALSAAVGRFEVGRRLRIIDGFSATMTRRQIEALARLPDVARVEEDSPVHALGSSWQDSFGVSRARVDAAVDGTGLAAAVIDTGIDAGHLDLDGGKVIAFKDLVNSRTEPYDDNGHGTAVAATLAGDGDARGDRLYQGVAPGAALVGVKVLNARGSGSMDDVVSALDWVVANKNLYGIRVVNISVGTSGCSDGTDAVSTAVDRAHDAGMVVLVAAGNEGPGTCTVGTPAAAAGAITVGAMADLGANGFRETPESGRGPTADGRNKPDVLAPGVTISAAAKGTPDQYTVESGTSMAAPFAAGVALLMLDADPSLTPAQVRDDMLQSAVDWGRGGDNRTAGTTGPDIDYGAGRLDAYAALEAAGADIDSPPLMPSHRLLEGRVAATGEPVDFPLTVADPQFPIAATLVIPELSSGHATSPNLDLCLYGPDGGDCVAVARTTARQEELGYRPTRPGVYTLRVSSVNGAADFLVDVSAGFTATPPANDLLPAPAGTATQGEMLTATEGAWTGTPPIAYSYQWRRCDAVGSGCAAVAGATARSYLLGADDVGTTLRVAVTGSNGAGASTAISSATRLIAAPAPPTDAGVAGEPATGSDRLGAPPDLGAAPTALPPAIDGGNLHPTVRIERAAATKRRTVVLEVRITGWKMYPKLVGRHNRRDGGHWVVYVDGRRDRTCTNAVRGRTTKLKPGRHRVRAALVHNDGSRLRPPVVSRPRRVTLPRRARHRSHVSS